MSSCGWVVQAEWAPLDYLRETQRTSLAHLERLIPYRPGTTMEIDEATRRSLELVRTSGQRRAGSPFQGVSSDRLVQGLQIELPRFDPELHFGPGRDDGVQAYRGRARW